MSFDVSLALPFPEAVNRVVDVLKEEGFGVLTRIDVHDTLKEKIGVEFRRYVILGACNPPLAHRALTAAPEVGLMLPCNVTVEETSDGGSLVRIVNPEEMMTAGGFGDEEEMAGVAADAAGMLKRVAEALAG